MAQPQGTAEQNPDQGEIERLKEAFCLWERADRAFQIGIVGTGPGFMSILGIIHNENYREFLPDMKLAALAEPGPHKGKVEFVKRLNVPIYDSARQMLERHPGLDLVIELTGNQTRLEALRAELPKAVSLIDHTAAVFLCGLHDMAQVNVFYQTNLRQQQALLQAVVDEIREDVVVLDKQGRVVDMNKNVWTRTGKDKSALIGLPCFEVQTLPLGGIFCPEPEKTCPFFATLASGQQEEAMLTRVNPEGQLLYFRVYSYPIHSQRGELTHIMVMHRDITARTYREKLQQQTDKLAIIGEMSTYLAHEIRNPLFAIGGFSNALLRSQNLSEKEMEKVRIIAEETKRLDSMLSSILNFAKPAFAPTGQADVAKVVEETVDLMTVGYSQHGFSFAVRVDPGLPRVKGQPEMLKQCLVNLIKNSMEAMPMGGPIEITAAMDKDWVRLTVSDKGRGMTDKDLEQAFSPFYTTKEKGCGLGLAMIKKLVEELGGRIELVSKLGFGAKVSLFLPPELAMPAKKAEAVPPATPEGQGTPH